MPSWGAAVQRSVSRLCPATHSSNCAAIECLRLAGRTKLITSLLLHAACNSSRTKHCTKLQPTRALLGADVSISSTRPSHEGIPRQSLAKTQCQPSCTVPSTWHRNYFPPLSHRLAAGDCFLCLWPGNMAMTFGRLVRLSVAILGATNRGGVLALGRLDGA